MAKVTGSNPVEPTALSKPNPQKISARADCGMPMKRPNWKAIGFLAFIALGAVSAALGCPFFRNPQNYMSAGGFVGYVQHLISVHRKA